MELCFGNKSLTGTMNSLSTLEIQIAERARTHKDEPLITLHPFIDGELLDHCFGGLNKNGAPGVDAQSWQEYDEQRSENIAKLLAAFKTGRYRAPAIRRAYIPQGKNKRRPLGLPTVEDKLLQTAVSKVLSPIYELGFTHEEDARRMTKVLSKRLAKYPLQLNPEKTRLVSLKASKDGKRVGNVDFLGFTHYMGKSRKGKLVLKRKTSSGKLATSLKRLNQWLKDNRHRPTNELVDAVNQKLRGHYAYYGVTFNGRSLNLYYLHARRLLHKWLNRRGGKTNKWNWEKYNMLVSQWRPLMRPKIYHYYILAKP